MRKPHRSGTFRVGNFTSSGKFARSTSGAGGRGGTDCSAFPFLRFVRGVFVSARFSLYLSKIVHTVYVQRRPAPATRAVLVLNDLLTRLYLAIPRTTAVDRRSTPSARADRQEPLPMFRCPGSGFSLIPDAIYYLVFWAQKLPPKKAAKKRCCASSRARRWPPCR